MTSRSSIVRFVSVSKLFTHPSLAEPVSALENISFAVPDDAFVFLTGPSGAGKSTLVRMIYGECLPSSGDVLVGGRSLGRADRNAIAHLRREIGIVHQEFHLIGRKSALRNVELPLLLAGIPRREARRLAEEALDEVGLRERRDHPVVELAGGEKQRTTLARALAMKPRMIVADEPTGNLDHFLSDEIFGILERFHARGNAVIVATHDLARIEKSARPVVYLAKGRLVGISGDNGALSA